MLVLSRKIGETICLGKDITVTVVDVDRGKVRIGIAAPKESLILREELLGTAPADKAAREPLSPRRKPS